MQENPRYVSAIEASKLTGQSERTIRRRIERGKLKAEKRGTTYAINIDDLEEFTERRTPDVRSLLERIQALEDLEDAEASQAQRLTELERRVSELEKRVKPAPQSKPAPQKRHKKRP